MACEYREDFNYIEYFVTFQISIFLGFKVFSLLFPQFSHHCCPNLWFMRPLFFLVIMSTRRALTASYHGEISIPQENHRTNNLKTFLFSSFPILLCLITDLINHGTIFTETKFLI